MRRKSRFPALVKGPDGKWLCRGCGGPVPQGRKTWCSRECVKKNDPFWVNQAAWKRDGGKCRVCGKDLTVTIGFRIRRKAEYDHIIPFSEGGKTTLDNIQCLCHECHKKKTANWRREKAQARKRAFFGQTQMELEAVK